ncbi:MAG: hypothetical protein ACPG4T_21780 [Nannocystaceae bacterium]
MQTHTAIALTGLLALTACGDGTSQASDSSDSTITSATVGATASSTDATRGSMSASESSSAGSESTTDEPTTGSSGPKLDVAAPDAGDSGSGDCTACGFDLNFSYVWIANAEEGTVSKIDTVSLQEVGRYYTRPDGAGSPSRTSVNFNGDVAVANRYGGLAKFYARHDDCDEMANGMPGLQTSTGAGDILAWGQDDCLAWYTEFATSNQRPVAWEQGVFNPDSCRYVGAKVWTVVSSVPGLPGLGGNGGVTVYRLDGETGEILNTVPIETFPGNQFGAYGGAVDSQGNLWFCPQGLPFTPDNKKLVRVNAQNLAYTVFTIPQDVASYGITVDADDYVWISSTGGRGVARFNPNDESWAYPESNTLSLGGLAQDQDGLMWVSTSSGAMGLDPTSLALVQQVNIPDGGTKGVAIDRDGFVWLVNEYAAYKFDKGSMMYEAYEGLNEPYTYSDFSGGALKNTTCGPPT